MEPSCLVFVSHTISILISNENSSPLTTPLQMNIVAQESKEHIKTGTRTFPFPFSQCLYSGKNKIKISYNINTIVAFLVFKCNVFLCVLLLFYTNIFSFSLLLVLLLHNYISYNIARDVLGVRYHYNPRIQCRNHSHKTNILEMRIRPKVYCPRFVVVGVGVMTLLKYVLFL